MTRSRSPRSLAALLGALLALAAVWPAGALAAPAPLDYGLGQLGNHDATGAVLGTVGRGEVTVFHLWAQNSGNSANIAQFYLQATTSGSFYGAHVSASNGAIGDANCGAGARGDAAMFCSFGSLGPGQWIAVTAAFTAPGSGTAMPVSFEWSANGYSTKKKNQSRGDAFKLNDSVGLSDGTHYDGRVAFDASLLLKPLKTSVATLNVNALGFGDHLVPLEIADGSEAAGFDCTSTATFTCPASYIGEPLYVNVDGGTIFGTAFTVQWIIKGVNPNQVNGVYHQWTDVNGVLQREIVTDQFAAGATPCKVPSFSVQKASGPKATIVTFVTYHNGNIRGI